MGIDLLYVTKGLRSSYISVQSVSLNLLRVLDTCVQCVLA